MVTKSPRNLYLVVGVGLFLLGLLCSFYLTFPDVILRQRLVYELETRLPIQVDLVEAVLQPLLTLSGEGMTVRLSGQTEAFLQIDSFHVSPQWASLLAGDPGLKGAINSSAGELSFLSLQSGKLDLTGADLPFDMPLATSPPMRLSGTLTSGEVTTTVPLQSATESRIDIKLDQVAVQGLEALTANAAGLRLGEISLQMSGQGTSFSIADLQVSGGDLLVSGEGTLMLTVANPQHSRINLNLSVRAGDQADPTLASLLELVGTQQADGSRKLRLTGTLAKPIIR
jgi:type II secretion system protein N